MSGMDRGECLLKRCSESGWASPRYWGPHSGLRGSDLKHNHELRTATKFELSVSFRRRTWVLCYNDIS